MSPRFFAMVVAVALVGCASPQRRIEADKVKVFTLAAPVRSVQVFLAPLLDPRLARAHIEAVSGWNTLLFDQRFGKRLVENFKANGVNASFRGASQMMVGSVAEPPELIMVVAATGFAYKTRFGDMQDGRANYGIRVTVRQPPSPAAVVEYEDSMDRTFISSHDDLPDRFTYSFFNLLKDRGQWPADRKIELSK